MGDDLPTFSSIWYECKHVHVTGYLFEYSSVVNVIRIIDLNMDVTLHTP